MHLIGESIGPYEIQALLGVGALGRVYRARHVPKGHPVALRRLPFCPDDPTAREHLRRRVAVLTHLRHPHLVSIYDYVEDERGLFLVMAYAEGEPLDGYVAARGPLDAPRVRALILPLLDAVAYAHDRGVTHGDLRPSNVRVQPDGRPVLYGCGVAALSRDQPELPPAAPSPTVVGYLSPEQIRGEAAGSATDIYSLGLLLYLLRTGRPPYDTAIPEDERPKWVADEPLPPLPADEPAFTAIDGAIRRATEKRPERRYERAKDFQHALRTGGIAAPAAGGRGAEAIVEVATPATANDAEIALYQEVAEGEVLSRRQERRTRALRRQGLWLALLMLVGVATVLFFLFRRYDPSTALAAQQQVERFFTALNERDAATLEAVFADTAERYYQHEGYPRRQILNNYEEYWRRVPYDAYALNPEQLLITPQNDGSFDVTVPTTYRRAQNKQIRMFDPNTEAYAPVEVLDLDVRRLDFRMRLDDRVRIIFLRERDNEIDEEALNALVARSWQLVRFSKAGLVNKSPAWVAQLRNQWQRFTRAGTLVLDPGGTFEQRTRPGGEAEDEAGTWTYEPARHLLTLRTDEQTYVWRVAALNDDQLVLQTGEEGSEEVYLYEPA
ncbi:MAG: serine/threonine-protein kinase [Catalinimonas sp.]